MKFTLKKDGPRFLAVLIASIIMAFNIKTFVRIGNLFPGGATGLTVLIQRLVERSFGYTPSYTLINVALNAIPIYIGFRYIGKKFTLYSLITILLTGILTDLFPSYAITYDTLLIAIFGGLLNGVAISLCLKFDATTGGTDFIAIYFAQKKQIETFNYVLGFNILILTIAGYYFGWDKALYSIIFQYVSTQVLHLLYRNYQRKTLLIITEKAEEIAPKIHEVCHHGATLIDVEGSYEHIGRKLVYSVVSTSDVSRVIYEVKRIDPKAFINALPTTEISGRFYIKPKD
ncbi:MAG: YitT family protein [Solobacterium sp.]|nr:YitT family protein [Solobacterium sp.]